MTVSLILILCGLLLISLSKDLERSLKWFLRSLGRVLIVVCLMGLGYALLYAPR